MRIVSKNRILLAATSLAISAAYANAAITIYGSPAFSGGNGGTGGFQSTGTTPVPRTNSSAVGTSVATGESLVNGTISYPSSPSGSAPVADNNDKVTYVVNSLGTIVRLDSLATNPTVPSGSAATSPLPGSVLANAINGDANLVVGYGTPAYPSGTATGQAAAEWNATTGALIGKFIAQNSDTGVWSTLSTTPTLTTTQYPTQVATAVNASGVTLGTSRIYKTGTDTFVQTVPVLWSSIASAPVLLPNAGTNSSGTYFSTAYAINGSGTVVGQAYNYDSAHTALGYRAVAWKLGATAPTLLPSASTSNNDFARAINANGVIAGYTATSTGQAAARWIPSASDPSGYTVQPLASIGSSTGSGTSYGSGDINAINSRGDVVGAAQVYSTSATTGPTGNSIPANTYLGSRPLLWTAGSTTPVQLQVDGTDANGGISVSVFHGPTYSAAAYSINAGQFSVGSAVKFNSSGNVVVNSTATLWDGSGTLTELNALIGITAPTNSGATADGSSGWTNLIEADGITDNGWISGYGQYYDATTATSYQRGFLIFDAAAVPEPASVATLAMVGGIAMVRRRRTSNAK